MDLESVSNYDEVKDAIMEKVLIMIFGWLFFHVWLLNLFFYAHSL